MDILRANHKEEFDAIKRDLKAMVADGLRFDRATAAPGSPLAGVVVGRPAQQQHGTQQAPADHPQASTGPDARNVGAR
jgi:hypothetical protein